MANLKSNSYFYKYLFTYKINEIIPETNETEKRLNIRFYC